MVLNRFKTMYTFRSTFIGLSVTVVFCSINVRRAGWLDRVVKYQKKRFIEDLLEQPVQFTARIETAPPGYVDSTNWDYDSIIRLLTLIRDSEGAAPVRRAFRNAIKNNRRFLSFSETFKAFPSLNKGHSNDLLYDIDSEEYYAGSAPSATLALELKLTDVIVITNPVEAKLPSARITVKLLKHILESRAEAARVMPKTALDIIWPVTPKRNASNTQNATSATASIDEVTTAESQSESIGQFQDFQNVTEGSPGNVTVAADVTSTNETEVPNPI